MPMKLSVKGASKSDIARGLAAAEAFMKMKGVTAAQASQGAWWREFWDVSGFPDDFTEYGPREQRWAKIWDEAFDVAVRTCCREWDEIPFDASLVFLTREGSIH